MQIAVCDDNKWFIQEFEDQLRSLEMVETISAFGDYSDFLFSVDEGRQYDAVFMDIDWDQELNGMDIAEKLYNISPRTKIVYITGYSERYIEKIFLHKSNLSGFLTKPVDREHLQANLQKIIRSMQAEDEPILVLRQHGVPIPILLREIIFIESQGHKVIVHTLGETVESYEKLETIMRSLPAGFYQCHKSYIVNMIQIRRFQKDLVLLKNGMEIPVSRARYKKTKDAFSRYMRKLF